MKKLRIIMILCFFALLMVPVVTFNREENVASEIDNRMLTNYPLGENYREDGDAFDLTEALEAYVQDRIGFRDEMIYGYTVLHDSLFHEMVHPGGMYGKDDYVFSKPGLNSYYSDYDETFVEMVEKIQKYCEERDVPFLFVFEPMKTSVMTDKLPDGFHYDNEWVRTMKEELSRRGIRYIDNTDTLKSAYERGEMVFNKQYNANHWNDLGAFYGMNEVLSVMHEDYPAVHVNLPEEFEVVQHLNTSLTASKFPIYEYEPYYIGHYTVTDRTAEYDSELERDERYMHFTYVINEEQRQAGAPKTLVFQGSYVNEIGYKFLENGLGEYISVHDYQNITEFDYYYNIFRPEYVIFEAAEYVFNDTYFATWLMEDMELNPLLTSAEISEAETEDLGKLSVDVEEGNALTVISVRDLPDNTRYAYAQSSGTIFDFRKREEKGDTWYELTIEKENYQSEGFEIIVVDENAGIIKFQ